MALDDIPSLVTMSNIERGNGVDAHLLPDGFEGHASFVAQVANQADLFIGQATLPASRPAFLHAIGHVVELGSGEDVRGIATGRVIAGMTTLHPLWQRTNEQCVGGAVCSHATLLKREQTVPGFSRSASPYPTVIQILRQADIRQESSDHRFTIKRLWTFVRCQVTRAAKFSPRIPFRLPAVWARLLGYTHRVILLNRVAGPRAFTAPRGIVVPLIVPVSGSFSRKYEGCEA